SVTSWNQPRPKCQLTEPKTELSLRIQTSVRRTMALTCSDGDHTNRERLLKSFCTAPLLYLGSLLVKQAETRRNGCSSLVNLHSMELSRYERSVATVNQRF